jgi:hypothetical protein
VLVEVEWTFFSFFFFFLSFGFSGPSTASEAPTKVFWAASSFCSFGSSSFCFYSFFFFFSVTFTDVDGLSWLETLATTLPRSMEGVYLLISLCQINYVLFWLLWGLLSNRAACSFRTLLRMVIKCASSAKLIQR